MARSSVWVLLGLVVLAAATAAARASPERAGAALAAAYPDVIAGVKDGQLVFRSGPPMPLDDGIAGKTFETLLDAPDIEDQFAIPYRAGPASGVPARDEDPGRIRYEPLFRKLYGDCRKGEVTARLVKVAWLPRHQGGTVSVTSANGVAAALRRVSEALDKLPADLVRYLKPTAGTYNCRAIAGTDRLSMHAYGAAIDINTRYADYWRWTKAGPAGAIAYRNRIPFEIVEAFEREGFIWGGKWYHYDTMHFEYRPELLAPPVGTSP